MPLQNPILYVSPWFGSGKSTVYIQVAISGPEHCVAVCPTSLMVQTVDSLPAR